MSSTIHREALFGPPRVSAPDDGDRAGRRAVFSASRRRPGSVVVDCGRCEARTPVVLPMLALQLVPSVWVPGRSFSRWMRCPACSAVTWCRIDWRALRPQSRRITTATCFHHTHRETGRICTRCGRPACSECLTEAPVGAHCFECIRAGQPPRRERIRRWNARNNLFVTSLLIAANAAVFVATSAQGSGLGGGAFTSELQIRLALIGSQVAAGEWYRVVTAGFVHDGLLHIAFNMLLLYRLGEMLEPALGRLRFASLYFAALVWGSLGALVVTPNAATVGASGAVFGLMGAAAVGLRQRGINVMQTGIGMLLVLNLVFTFAASGISIGGHIGGLLGGAAIGSVMLRTPTTPRSVRDGVMTAAVVTVAALFAIGWTVHR